MMRPSPAILAFIALVSGSAAVSGPAEDLASQAEAATPDAHHGMLLYLKHCAACHGRHAWGDEPREIPVLAGQHPSYLIRQLAQFAVGARPGSEMHGPVMHDALQPADVNRGQALSDLAAYLAGTARNPQPEHGDGQTLKLGEAQYTRGCTGCHGSDGAGRDRGAIPAIGGQGYRYLLSRLRSFAAGRLAHPALAETPAALSSQEQSAVADYASRLPYLTGPTP